MKSWILKIMLFFTALLSQHVFSQTGSNYYWVGGPGSWQNLNKWRIGSSTGPQATIVPSRYDNVFFTGQSGFLANSAYPQSITTDTEININNFTVDDTFIGDAKLQFANYPNNSSFNIFGDVKISNGFRFYDKYVINLMPDNNTVTPKKINIPNNIFWYNASDNDGDSWSNAYKYATINLFGNGKYELMNNLGKDKYDTYINISNNAQLITNGYKINSKKITYSSSVVSDFTTSKLEITEGNFNSNVNLSNVDISLKANYSLTVFSSEAYNLTKLIFNGAQNVKSIDPISRAFSIESTVGELQVGNLTTRGPSDFKGLFSINNYSMAGGIVNLDNTSSNYYFKINSTLNVLNNCTGIANELKGSAVGAKLIIPNSAGGGNGLNFVNVKLTNIDATQSTNVKAGLDGGGNTGNITYLGYTARNFYWIGRTGGNINDPNNWSLTSGGISAGCIPNKLDNAIFDSNSTSTNITIGVSNQYFNPEISDLTVNANHNIAFGFVYNIFGNADIKEGTMMNGTVNFNSIDKSGVVKNKTLNVDGVTFGNVNFSGNDRYTVVANNSPNVFDLLSTSTITISSFSSTDTLVLILDNARVKARVLRRDNATLKFDNASLELETLTYNSSSSGYTLIGNGTKLKVATIDSNFNVNQLEVDEIILDEVSTGITQYVFGGGNIKANKLILRNGKKFRTRSNITVNEFYNDRASDIEFDNPNLVFTVNNIFSFPKNACDTMSNFYGYNYGFSSVVLGNNINNTGKLDLNKLNIKNLRFTNTNVLVTAYGSINEGGNQNIVFAANTPKDFYWRGGAGSWNAETNWFVKTGTNPDVYGKCGVPTVYDNVFFDAESGFTSATNGNIVSVTSSVYVNNMTWTDAPNNPILGGDLYVNGELELQKSLKIVGDLRLINQYGKTANITKNIRINGALLPNFVIQDAAIYKFHKSLDPTVEYDVNILGSSYLNLASASTMDLGNVRLNVGRSEFNGRLLLDNTYLKINGYLKVNTVSPILDNNSTIVINGHSGTGGSTINARNHYFNRIDIISDSQSSSFNNFTLGGGTINQFNILPSSVLNYNLNENTSVTINLVGSFNVNHLRVDARNIIKYANDITVNQSLQLGSVCYEQLKFIGGNANAKLVLPNYNSNPSAYTINNTYLKNVKSSNNQTYLATNSTDGGSNVGIDFGATNVPETLYWIGGAGIWSDASHWSRTSGGSPITDCKLPRKIDSVIFDVNSGFAANAEVKITDNIEVKNITFVGVVNPPALNFQNSLTLSVYGNITLQSGVRILPLNLNNNYIPTIVMVGDATGSTTQTIDTKGIYTDMTLSGEGKFQLASDFTGWLNISNAASFVTNNYNLVVKGLDVTYSNSLSYSPIINLGTSKISEVNNLITGNRAAFSRFTLATNNNTVNLSALDSKIEVKFFTITSSQELSFGEVAIQTDGIYNTGSTIMNINRLVFKGSSSGTTFGSLLSSGNYGELYFNPGNYRISGTQNIANNLFMTGTACNRINVQRHTIAASNPSMILGTNATYTLFYGSFRDLNFSKLVNAYGNSQDLGNNNNLYIVPTNVQAVGFGTNKDICSTDFPKTFDASELYGTDPNATFEWRKTDAPNAGIISTNKFVTFSQAGSYSVTITYGQDNCTINQSFTVTSIEAPINLTTNSETSYEQSNGNVEVKFKGSDPTKVYKFIYNVNGGTSQEIVSTSNGEAIILQPRSQVGTFVYNLEAIMLANTDACVIPTTTSITVRINLPCTIPGFTSVIDGDYTGCTQNEGLKILSEVSPITVPSAIIKNGYTEYINNVGVVFYKNGEIFLLANATSEPIDLSGLPAEKAHKKGKIIFHNDHYYEGVDNGKWIQIDNY